MFSSQNRRARIYWSLTCVAAALLMSFVAPRVYGARSASHDDNTRLGNPTGRGVTVTESSESSRALASTPTPAVPIVPRQSRRGEGPPQRRRAQRNVQLDLGLGVDVSIGMVQAEDPSAVLETYETTTIPSTATPPTGNNAPAAPTTTLSDAQSLLLGDKVVKGVATFQHSILGGPQPGTYRAPHPFHLRPRFQDGGVQGAVTWSF